MEEHTGTADSWRGLHHPSSGGDCAWSPRCGRRGKIRQRPHGDTARIYGRGVTATGAAHATAERREELESTRSRRRPDARTAGSHSDRGALAGVGPSALVGPPHDDHGTGRVGHAVLTDRAQEQTGETAVAAGAHDQQRRVLGRVEQLLGG